MDPIIKFKIDLGKNKLHSFSIFILHLEKKSEKKTNKSKKNSIDEFRLLKIIKFLVL